MAGPITIACPACRGKLKLPNRNVAGKRVRCPKCEHAFVVELPAEEEFADELGGLDEFEDYGASDEQGYDDYDDSPPPRKASRGSAAPRKKSRKRKAANWQTPALIGGIAAAVLLVGGLGFWLIGSAVAAGGAADMAWLPPDSELIFSARVGKIVQDPNIQKLLTHPDMQEDLEKFKQQIGLQPGEGFEAVESLVAGMRNLKAMQGGGKSGPPDFITVVRKKTPWNLASVKQNAREATHAGKTYYVLQLDQSDPPCVYYPDERTCVLGPEEPLKQAIARGGALQSLANFEFVDFSKDVVVAFAPNDRSVFQIGQQPQMPPMMMLMGGVGPAIQKLMEAIPQLQGVAAGSDIGSSPELLVQANFIDGRAASKCAGALETLLGEAYKMLDQAKQAGGPMAGQMAQAEDVLDSIFIDRSGTTVAASLTVPESVRSAMQQQFDPSMLLEPIRQARTAARRSQSNNNLKQIGLALHNYHDAYNKFPVAEKSEYRGPDGKPLLSWRVHILPFLEQQALYDQFHLNEPWDSPHNRALVSRMPEVFTAANSQIPAGKTAYLTVTGPGAVFENGDGRSLRDITDGTSNTIMVVQASPLRAAVWTRPDDFEFEPSNLLTDLVTPGQSHFTALFADGSVHQIPLHVGPQMLKNLFTRNDGQEVDLGFGL